MGASNGEPWAPVSDWWRAPVPRATGPSETHPPVYLEPDALRFAWSCDPKSSGTSAVVVEWVSCGWTRCLRCGGALYAHGPYWWEYAGGRRVPLAASSLLARVLEGAAALQLQAWMEAGFGLARQSPRWAAFVDEGAPRRRAPPRAQAPRAPQSPPGDRGERSRAPPPPREPSVHDDLARLGLERDYTRTELARAYKRAAVKAHPDQGGRTEDLRDLNLARDRLLERLDGPRAWEPRDEPGDDR